MRGILTLAAGVFFLATPTMIGAKELRYVSGPAEVPPSSFTASMYVDSKGCAFIRAGYGGSVTWVPRVERNRKQVCGLPPSLAGTTQTRTASTTTTTSVAPRSVSTSPRTTYTPSPPPAPWTQPLPSATETVSAPKTATWDLAQLFGAPSRTSSGTESRGFDPDFPGTYHQPLPSSTKTASVAAPKTNAGFTWLATGFRTQPRAAKPLDYMNTSVALAANTSQPLRAVVEPQVVPAGYKSLLDEDANFAYRGIGSAQGKAAMDLVWTDTVPRRLIDATSGRDVTAMAETLMATTVSTRAYYPAGPAPVGTSSAPGSYIDEASPLNMTKIEDVAAYYGDDQPPSPVAVAKSFVQIATFGVPANARRTEARFASSGLPTSSRFVTRGGRTLEIILLGPFADAASMQQALKIARTAGFSDAFYVK